MFDNQIFNVNGNDEELLLHTLKLAFMQSEYKCVGWSQSITHGLQLEWAQDTHTNIFPSRLVAGECFTMVVQWLKGDFAKNVECKGMDTDIDQDGTNERGWRVYREDDGGRCPTGIICRIKPAYIWYGK